MRRIFLIILLAIASPTLLAAEVYHDPADGKAYGSPGWKMYQPQNPGEKQAEKVALEGVRLLSSQQDFQSSTDAGTLANFIRAVHAQAREVFAQSNQPSELLLQFECLSSSQKLRIAFQGAPEKALLQQLYDAIARLPRLEVHANPVTFQMQFKINPSLPPQ